MDARVRRGAVVGRALGGAGAALAVPGAAWAHHPGPDGHGAWWFLIIWGIALVFVALWVLDVLRDRHRSADSRRPPADP